MVTAVHSGNGAGLNSHHLTINHLNVYACTRVKLPYTQCTKLTHITTCTETYAGCLWTIFSLCCMQCLQSLTLILPFHSHVLLLVVINTDGCLLQHTWLCGKKFNGSSARDLTTAVVQEGLSDLDLSSFCKCPETSCLGPHTLPVRRQGHLEPQILPLPLQMCVIFQWDLPSKRLTRDSTLFRPLRSSALETCHAPRHRAWAPWSFTDDTYWLVQAVFKM